MAGISVNSWGGTKSYSHFIHIRNSNPKLNPSKYCWECRKGRTFIPWLMDGELLGPHGGRLLYPRKLNRITSQACSQKKSMLCTNICGGIHNNQVVGTIQITFLSVELIDKNGIIQSFDIIKMKWVQTMEECPAAKVYLKTYIGVSALWYH